MNQFDKIPKYTGYYRELLFLQYKQMIFLFYKYFKPYQTLNLVENNRKSYDINVIHSSSDKKQ